MKTYKLEAIFKFAYQVEEQGREFYDQAAAYTKKVGFRNLFSKLAKAEVKHAKTFLKLHRIFAKKKAVFPADERFQELLDTLARGLLFPDFSEVRSALDKDNDKTLIFLVQIAMNVELNTLVFYKEIQAVVPQLQTESALERIIKEEEKHLIKLKNMRRKIDLKYAKLGFGRFY